MIGIYMSGTGNTKHCVGKLLSVIDPKAEMIPCKPRTQRKATSYGP